ncbi:MAG: aminotransferase class V-fold PLP-dependent enzyme [Chitinophagaceae bacterium]|nr:aminotransferase class V-fold PLP-dependent enzyme [Chitinophagaceae bacterium]
MSDRRNFIQKAALLAGAFAVGNYKLNAQNILLEKPRDDESFWKNVRDQFPLNPEKIYLNNGTLGASPYSVIHAVQQHMMEVDVNASHGTLDKQVIKALAGFLNTNETEISLTHNVTEGINIVCWGLPLKAGDEVKITNHEHAGNASPWLNRWKISGIKLIVVSLGNTAEETLTNISKAITPKTKLINVPHIPCTTGQVLPVKDICTLARTRNIWSFLDGAHPTGMIQLNLEEIGCDFYAGCCHKWLLGTKGTGFLYVAADSRKWVQPIFAGAGVDTGWNLKSTPIIYKGYSDNGHRYYFGTQNESLYQGIIKAIDFQQEIGRSLIEKRVKYLANYLQQNLLSMGSKIQMLTPKESISKAAIISFKIADKDISKLQNQCSQNNIITRFVPENDINCLRISTHIYNSISEVDSFLTEVDKFLKT